jgi:catechol-2,3-dioxygenase
VFNHLALEVKSREEVDRWCVWLNSQGVEPIGPIDHGLIYSVYFFDNNGLRTEITTTIDPEWNRRPEQAQKDLTRWKTVKSAAIASGQNVSEALFNMIEREK